MLDAETKRRIDNARDILVGKVPDPKTQVEQITFAMIYKFMDDMDQQSVSIGGEPSFFTNGYEQFAWSKLMDKRLGGEARLDLYVRALDQMSQNPHIPQLFRDIFKGAFLPYRDSETLNLFLKEMNGFNYTHSEDLGDAYEYLLSIFASQGKAGQFRTPRHIIDFIVDCVNPNKNDTVLDPACGTAGFLISAYKHILEAHNQDPLSPDEKKRLTENFVGYDISPDMVRLSRVNMYLHQFPNPTIHEYDTLTNEDRWDDNFDVILANPPFMTPKGGIRPHNRFAVRANRSEVLFVDYIAEHLNPGGRAGVVVPEGIIFQSGNAYKALRRMLVEEGYLYAVISLPAGVFNPYSGVKTSILLLDKTLARRSDSVLFIKISADGFDLGAQRREIERNDVPEALRLVKAFQSDPSFPLLENDLAQAVTKSKLSENSEYNLSAERYRKSGVVNSKWPMVKLGDVAEYINGFPFKPEDWTDEGIEIIRIQNLTKSSKTINRTLRKDIPPKYFVQVGDLLISWSATIGFYLWTGEGAYLNQHIFKVTPRENILKEYLYYLGIVITEKIEEKVHGNTMRHITKGLFNDIEIPLPTLEVQREIVTEIEGYQKVIDGARQVIENYKPIIPIDPSWPLVKLAEVCDYIRGVTYKKQDEVEDGGNVILRANNIDRSSNELNLSELKHIRETVLLPENRLIRANDIVICAASGSKDHIGKVAFVSKPLPYYIGGFMALIRCKERLNPRFLFGVLKSADFRNYLKITIQAASINNLYAKTMYDFEISLPPPELQSEIVREIEETQKLVDANKQLIQRMEQKN